jgi:hypothetical protein
VVELAVAQRARLQADQDIDVELVVGQQVQQIV